MKHNKYKFEDIEIGDGVYFDDEYSSDGRLIKSNRDSYWIVNFKDKNHLNIEIHKEGIDDYWSVRYDEIRQVEKRNI